MRKLGFSLFSCMALVAFMALGAPAFAAVDPSCDGDPYNNEPVIHDFAIATPDSSQAGAVSGLEGSGLACGTDVSLFQTGTVYDHADILVAPGVEINGTAGIAENRFVGTSVVNVASNWLGIVLDQASWLRISPIANCDAENPVGGDIPGTIIACYKGSNALGYNYNWTTVTAGGEKWLTIGPFYPSVGIAGLTHIKQFNLCGNVGAVGGTEQTYPNDCGDSSQPYLQKNGDASYPNCDNGKGIYTVTATMRNGFTTPEATTCVQWTRPPRPCKATPPGGLGGPESTLKQCIRAQRLPDPGE